MDEAESRQGGVLFNTLVLHYSGVCVLPKNPSLNKTYRTASWTLGFLWPMFVSLMQTLFLVTWPLSRGNEIASRYHEIASLAHEIENKKLSYCRETLATLCISAENKCCSTVIRIINANRSRVRALSATATLYRATCIVFIGSNYWNYSMGHKQCSLVRL